MKVINTDIPEVLIFEPKLFGDHRGFFVETFQVERYEALGLRRPFVQDNMSRSARGVLRGLHLQYPLTQGKLVSVLRGRVVDVAVDVRLGSPTFGHHVAVELSDDNLRQFWVPRGSPTDSLFFQNLPIFSTSAIRFTALPTNSPSGGTTLRLESIGG